jgi:magnesium transporter
VSDELAICQTFITTHGPEAARALERLPGSQVAALLEAMPARVAAQALAAMVPTIASDCLTQLSAAHAAAALAELPAGQAAVLLRRLDKIHVTGILEQMSPDDVRLLGTILNYPPDCAGSLMESRVFAASESLRVGDALSAIRRLPRQLHDYVFVVDDGHRLVGVARLRDLLASRRHQPLAGIMNRAVSHLPARAPRAAVLNHPGWKHFHTLPVVDDATVLVGAIAHATIRAIFEEDVLGRSSKADTATTVFALGELYWMGLSGVLDGVASAVRRLGAGEAEEVRRGRH